MKNMFEIREECTAIYIFRKNGDSYEVIIDTDDLILLHESFNGTWSLRQCMDTGRFYVVGGSRHPLFNGHPYLHRIIMNAPPKTIVDHINHNSLDNRRCNLRVVDDSKNQLNRSGPQKNNISTGVRNVTLVRDKYRVQMKVRGKAMVLGDYNDIETAKKVACNVQRVLKELS